jgi:hypothetical protein
MTAILTCSRATRDYGRSDIARSIRFHGADCVGFAAHWTALLVLRTLVALCLGGALTLA